jgi:hypothetical protein
MVLHRVWCYETPCSLAGPVQQGLASGRCIGCWHCCCCPSEWLHLPPPTALFTQGFNTASGHLTSHSLTCMVGFGALRLEERSVQESVHDLRGGARGVGTKQGADGGEGLPGGAVRVLCGAYIGPPDGGEVECAAGAEVDGACWAPRRLLKGQGSKSTGGQQTVRRQDQRWGDMHIRCESHMCAVHILFQRPACRQGYTCLARRQTRLYAAQERPPGGGLSITAPTLRNSCADST